MSKDNFSLEDAMRLAKAAQGNTPEDMLSAMQGKISGDKVSEIKKILGDKKALEELLRSEQAQRLMKQFGKK